MLNALAIFLGASLVQIIGASQEAAPSRHPREIRITAQIDGTDELLLSSAEARWIHHLYSAPELVEINGILWDVNLKPLWSPPKNKPFIDPKLDLAGATVTFLSDRGEIDFRHSEAGLNLSFDDARAGGAGEFDVLIEFADELCAQGAQLGDPAIGDFSSPVELLIEARIDGRDELRLSSSRADWVHQSWSWPTQVKLGNRPWDPQSDPLDAAPASRFFAPGIELDAVQMEVRRGRGTVQLRSSGERLILSFDDEASGGADDYAVLLTFPAPTREVKPLLPSGSGLRVEVTHTPASDVAGAKLTVLALSPRTGEYIPWPGLRGMDWSGRCVVALPEGTYRFEVLHPSGSNRLVALRSGPVVVGQSMTLELPSSKAHKLSWVDGQDRPHLDEFAIQSILGDSEVSWRRSTSKEGLELVISPTEDFAFRAIGNFDDKRLALWGRRAFGAEARLDSTTETWVVSDFNESAGQGNAIPANSEVQLHFPRSKTSFSVTADTRFFTNRRFLGYSYSHDLADGGSVVFHRRQLLLPEFGEPHTFRLGGELIPRASAAILLNENLGSPTTKQLWWALELIDPSGSVLDTQSSSIGWDSEAILKSGLPMPVAPLDEAGLALIGDPADTVELRATYSWNGPREIQAEPAVHVALENNRYRTSIPGEFGGRARAYLDKANRLYDAIEVAREKLGTHTAPIEIRWWLNDGAVGAWGAITMPLGGMTADFDWFSMPWALAHESLHAFGYPHGEELEYLDSAAIREFDRQAWAAEFNPDFIPANW